ncbi:hypothetical protein [Moraxella nasicaprae]|nr:hypothetical protein [Moraxella nasicaprae]
MLNLEDLAFCHLQAGLGRMATPIFANVNPTWQDDVIDVSLF